MREFRVPMHAITLTTDFGLSDWYVGAMKGAILRINPKATIVDITHQVPPGDIRAGALALTASYRFFPRGTIHVAVVDPGVGGKRFPILAQTRDYYFIGPDNGLLSFALAGEDAIEVLHLTHATRPNSKVSQTFHGRDLFGPAAAHLSNGKTPRKLGSPQSDYVRLRWPEPALAENRIIGEILYEDRFGNMLTNIPESALRNWEIKSTTVCVARFKRALPLVQSYESVPTGSPLAIIGSSGFLEIAVNNGSAKEILGLRQGDAVRISTNSKHSRSR